MAWWLRWRSLRDRAWMLVLLAVLSMLVTLHLGHRLPWMKEIGWTQGGQIMPSSLGHLGMQRNIQRMDSSNNDDNNNRYKENEMAPKSDNGGTIRLGSGPKQGKQLLLSALQRNKAWAIQEDGVRSSRSNATRSFWQGQGKRKRQPDDFLAVLEFLRQVEKPSIPPSATAHSVLVDGPLPSIKQHFPLIESAFHKYKMDSTYISLDGLSTQSPGDRDVEEEEEDNWSVLMCLNTSMDGSGCVVTARHTKRKLYQKENVVPGLVLSPVRACDVNSPNQSKPGTRTGKWYGLDLPCFPLDSLYTDKGRKEGDLTSTPCQTSSGWWLSGLDQGGNLVNDFVACGQDTSDINVLRHSAGFRELIAIPLPEQPFCLNDRDPFIWQTQVLVTSASPLRAYFHPSGISWEGPSAFIRKKPQRSVSLMELQQLISDLHSDDTAFCATNMLEDIIGKMLLYTEKTNQDHSSSHRKCERCFQLLEVVMTFNTSFHPFIIQVSPTAYANGLSSLSSYLVEQSVLDDLAAMLGSRVSMAMEVSVALSTFGLTSIGEGKLCNADISGCLDVSQLIYLMDTRREHWASKNWRRLHPRIGAIDSPLQSANSSFLFHNRTNQNFQIIPFDENGIDLNAADKKSNVSLGSSFFHDLITAMGSFFLHPDFSNYLMKYHDISMPGDGPKNQHANIIDHQPSSPYSFPYLSPLGSCDNNSSTMPYLSAIHFHPHLKLQPQFSPLTTEYNAYVPYNHLVVSIRAQTKHCQALAMVDKISITNRWENVSLGLGENMIHVVVVDSGGNFNHWGLNAYKIRIHRIRKDRHLGRFNANTTHPKVCSLKQDCFLLYSGSDRCGLQKSGYFSSWPLYLAYRSKLPSCSSHQNDGEWMIPCSNCHDNTSCFWQEAVWQTYGCQEKTLTKEELKNCFREKKVLFIGDSTNRGILHYLIERINETLGQWDKTHNIKVYSSLNDGRTSLGFAYYPQFWLPLDRRPLFETAVTKLIQRISPVRNSSKTVIALGGVHWLERHHLDNLVTTLQSKGLSGAQVIVKGLGAGFHQPIGSLRHLTLGDQTKLLEKNEALLSYAISKGFQVFDTFKMTMARYQDFLQGKCACHFQRVSERRTTFWNKSNHIVTSPFDIKPQFHVEGNVGAAYSEMFINRICVEGYG